MSDPWTADVAAVLFDMDGTLLDSTAAVARSWARWGERWGGGRFTGYDHGRPARQLIADLVPEEQRETAFRDIESIEVGDTRGIVPLPGALALLAALPPDRWAVVTSSSAPLAAARLAVAGLEPPVLVTADDVARGKPSPDPFLLAASRLGVDPTDCLVVEDAPAGAAAGGAAGARVLAVLGTVPADELAAADAVVDSLTAVRVEASGGRIRVTAVTDRGLPGVSHVAEGTGGAADPSEGRESGA